MTKFRAVLALALLGGVYLLALLVFGAAVGSAWFALHSPTAAGWHLALVTCLAAAAVLRGLWAGLRGAGNDADEGDGVSRTEQPLLWSVVDELAEKVGTRAPDAIYLVPMVNAAVVEDSSWLGLKSGTRRMYVGLPLLQAMSTSEAKAVLAHELGHYSGRHTALGPIVYRGHASLENVIRHLRGHHYIRLLFTNYAKLYFRVTRKVSRDQEFEADAASAAIVGRDPAIGALSRLPAITAAWGFFLDRYVVPPVKTDVVPATLLSGFTSLLSEPERQAELAKIPVETAVERDPYDTHPPLAERIRVLQTLPAGGATDDRPATALLSNLDALEARMPELLLTKSCQPVTWEQAAQRVAEHNAASVATELLNATRSIRQSPTATIGTAVTTISEGRGSELAAAMSRSTPPAEQARLIGWALQNLAACGLASIGRLHWTVSWTGSPWRVVSDEDLSDIPALTTAAIADPTKGGALAQRVAALGIPADFTTIVAVTDPYESLRTL